MIALLKKTVKDFMCAFCGKPKDGEMVEVEFSDQKGASVLCWTCLRKQVQWRARQVQKDEPKLPFPEAKMVGNGSAAAVPVK